MLKDVIFICSTDITHLFLYIFYCFTITVYHRVSKSVYSRPNTDLIWQIVHLTFDATDFLCMPQLVLF